MRVPLDYYRILGLPIQATAEQLQQAHHDRTHQLPRREFSEAAIASRNSLIDQAYDILSDAEQRQAYDATLLAKSYDLLEVDHEFDAEAEGNSRESNGYGSPEPDRAGELYTPTIDIADSQFVGALLILLEMGEYELVVKLGRPYLSGADPKLDRGDFGDPQIIVADVVLTVALACLELGREQWQQGQYENAAESLEVGQQLLLRENVFANIRGEIQADLYKLRPYRVLELLALSESRESERRQGITLLEGMLQERGGIDGTGEDQSGLNMDDFLRFVQQIRSYLTSSEQQVIFEYESRRPSPVATYLAVYALIARGFAQRQPVLIRRAKSMLGRLGIRQDVHLEQSICALLLGQTEEANRVLDLSREYDSLAFIRENSQDSPDLLPGLCLYTERWLQDEVFPHFRDLSQKRASLKDYFADEDVQAYLEALPNETSEGQWSAPSAVYAPIGRDAIPAAQPEPQLSDFPEKAYPSASATGRPVESRSTYDTGSTSYAMPPAVGRTGGADRSTARSTARPTDRPTDRPSDRPTDRPTDRSTVGAVSGSVVGGSNGYSSAIEMGTPPPSRYPTQPPVAVSDQGTAVPHSSTRRGHSTFRWDRLLLLVGLGVATILLLMFLLSRLLRGNDNPSRANVGGTAASGTVGSGTVGSGTVGSGTVAASPNAPSSGSSASSSPATSSSNAAGSSAAPAATGTGVPAIKPVVPALVAAVEKFGGGQSIAAVTSESLTLESAEALVQNWLTAKAAAMGETHASDKLSQVLTGGALSQWQYWSNEAKAGSSPLRYEHTNLKVSEVNVDADDPNIGTIDATVTEKREPTGGTAETQDLTVRYTVMRDNGEWKIQSIDPQ